MYFVSLFLFVVYGFGYCGGYCRIFYLFVRSGLYTHTSGGGNGGGLNDLRIYAVDNG